jgi:hypothetical protein
MTYNSNGGIANRNSGGIYNSGSVDNSYWYGNAKVQKEIKELDEKLDTLESNFNTYVDATNDDIVHIENNAIALEGSVSDINTRLSGAESTLSGYSDNFDTVNLVAQNADFTKVKSGKYLFDHGYTVTGTNICKINEGSQVWATDGTNSILVDYTNKDAWVAKAKTSGNNKFMLYSNGVLAFTASGGWSVYVIGNDITTGSASGNYDEIATGITIGGTLYATLPSNFTIGNITVAHKVTADEAEINTITTGTITAENETLANLETTNADITNADVTDADIENLDNSKRNIQKNYVQINASDDTYVYIGISKFTGIYNLKLIGTDALGHSITQFTAEILWQGQDPIVKYSEYNDNHAVDYLYKIVLTHDALYFVTTGAGTLYYSWDAMNGVETPTSGEWSNTPYVPEDVIADYDIRFPNRTVFFGDHSAKSGVDILGELNADWIKYPDGFSVDNLTVHETLTVEGDTTTRTLNVNDDSNFGGEATFEDDVTIHGDLYVTGTTTTTSEAQVSSSGNYLVTRDNNNLPMLEGEYSGVAVNNYNTGKIATLTADHEGTWRVSDSATSTAHTYTNISAWNGNFYSGLSQTTTTGPTGILTNVDADELASVVLNGTDYYHKAGNDWYGPVTLENNVLSIGSIVTDQTLIDTLDSLTKNDLIYYRSVTDKSIDTSTNQPLLTRSEVDDLSGNHILKWDSTNNKAIDSGVSATTANNVTCVTADQFCGALKGNADTATNATNATNADKGKNGSSYSAFGSNAFNSTAFTTCTGTVTSINIYCGKTCKCGITTSGNICLGTNAFNSTAFTTCTGTVTKVKVGTTEYSPSSGVVSLPAYPTSIACADKGKNGNSYSDFGSNAFNSTAFTTCTGTVTKVKVGTTEYSPTSGVISLPAYPSSPSCVACAGCNGSGKAFGSAAIYNIRTGGSVTYVPYSGTDANCVLTGNFLAYWNGAYANTGASNLRYYCGGAFGSAAACAATAFRASDWWPNSLSCGCVCCANRAGQADYASAASWAACIPANTSNCYVRIFVQL